MRSDDPLRLASGTQAPGREIGVVGYLLETSHGPVYRWTCVMLAIGAAAIMGAVLWSSYDPPHNQIIYRYQWPVIWARPAQQIDV